MFPFYTLLMQLENNRFHPFLKASLDLILKYTGWCPRRCPHGTFPRTGVWARAAWNRRTWVLLGAWTRAAGSVHTRRMGRAWQQTERHEEQKHGLGRPCVPAYAYVSFGMMFTCDADGNHPLLREDWCGLATRLHRCKYHTKWSQRED
jgi:hypothetical protein